MKHLFLFTISPVQSFISQARKTQDLYAGSRLLSDLVKAGAKKFENKKGKLIFPNTNAETFTNRFFGEITTEIPKKIGKEIEQTVRSFLVEKSMNAVRKVIGNKKLPLGFTEQIENLLDIKWAFTEWNGNAKTYKKAYDEIEKLVGAIKNARTFEQYNYQIINGEKIIGEQGRKCSIDGERNVKFYRKTKKDIEKDKKSANHTLKRKLFIDNPDEVCFIDKEVSLKYLDYGEGLSAVSFFKRCYEKENNLKKSDFPSTSEIALMQLEIENQNTFDNYKKLFDKKTFPTILINHFDKININNFQTNFNDFFNYHYFYKENLTEEEFPNKDQLKWIKKWHSKFIQPIIGTRKNRYYAIIVSDGDGIGKWLSGKKLEENNNLYEFHKKLSESLSKFSKKAEQSFNSPEGKAVYAGGDDFMGFVNLEHLFPVLQKLHVLFSEINTDLANNPNFTIKENKKLTLSAGIAIAHYKTPLGIVLKKARDMEKLAKQHKNNTKDAFAIAVLKRSGEINQTVWKWQANDEKYTTKIIENIVEELQRSIGISNTFIKNIQIEFDKLQNEKGELSVNSLLLEEELKRLLKKSRDKKMPDNNFETVFSNLKILLPQKNDNLNNFFMALNIADFIQRNTNGLKVIENGK